MKKMMLVVVAALVVFGGSPVASAAWPNACAGWDCHGDYCVPQRGECDESRPRDTEKGLPPVSKVRPADAAE